MRPGESLPCFFEVFPGFILLAQFAQGKPPHIGPPSVGRVVFHQVPAGFNRLEPFLLPGVGGGEEIVDSCRLRVLLEEFPHDIEYGLVVALAQVDFSQAQIRFRKIGFGTQGRLQIGFGLDRVTGLEVGAGQQVESFGGFGLLLEDLLKILHRLRVLALGEVHPAAHQQSLRVRRVLAEHGFERLEASFGVIRSADHVGLPVESRQIIRILGRNLVQDLPGGIGFVLTEHEVGKIDLGLSIFRRQVNGCPEFLLGSNRVFPGLKKPSHRQVPVAQIGFQGQHFLELSLSFSELPLLEIQGAEGQVEPGVVFEFELIRFQAPDGVVHFLGGGHRLSEQDLCFKVPGRFVEQFEQIIGGRAQGSRDDIEFGQAKNGACGKGFNPHGFFHLRLGLGDVARLNGGQPQEIVGLGVLRARLDYRIEILERFGGFALHEIGAPSQLEAFEVGGVLLEHRVKGFEGILYPVFDPGQDWRGGTKPAESRELLPMMPRALAWPGPVSPCADKSRRA